jgi:YEATS domain-containing protein 4
LTPLIERVIFQLHPDFNNPTRVIDTAPFHVSELGWGEFEVVIKVFFHEGPDTPIELRHLLALFPKTGEPSTKKPVVSEKHDEFVFNQPNEALLQRIHMCNTRLVTTGGQGNHSWGGVEPWLTRLNQHDELLRIQAAQRRVQAETELLKEEYARVHETHTVLQEEVKLLDPGKR